MKKINALVLRVMKAVNSEYRFVRLSTGSAEIIPNEDDKQYPFSVCFHTVYAPSKCVGARSLKDA